MVKAAGAKTAAKTTVKTVGKSGGKPEAQRCGYVSIIGAPNAGKSTLLNALTGAKVSIISHRPQTTRMRILGIASMRDTQICFLDTPGIFVPKKRLERAMVDAAWKTLDDADAIVLVIDADKNKVVIDPLIVERLGKVKQSLFLVLNKVDAIKEKARLLPLAEQLNKEMPFKQIFMISALTGNGIDELRLALANAMPHGPWMFDREQLTDLPERLMAAELTREQVFNQLYQELPYAAAVVPGAWEKHKDGSVRITQTIIVQRDTQKAIVLGDKGSRIKQIGQKARAEIAGLVGKPVHLILDVKAAEDWQEKRDYYEMFGLDFSTGKG